MGFCLRMPGRALFGRAQHRNGAGGGAARFGAARNAVEHVEARARTKRGAKRQRFLKMGDEKSRSRRHSARDICAKAVGVG